MTAPGSPFDRTGAHPAHEFSFLIAETTSGRQAARIAVQNGFEFWLDVIDPQLISLATQPLSPRELALLTAAIIEMAVINCTHVLALMTKNTRGSSWVPYEYGRIKELPFNDLKAAAWRHPDLSQADLAEYLELGPIHTTRKGLNDWFTGERPGECQTSYPWPFDEPGDLPG